MIRYCTRCVMPDTKPDLTFDDEGVCSACRNYTERTNVGWDHRRQQLVDLLDRYRNPNGYDCIVPVSGGKDSTYQVLRMLELGANPLCVTATTDKPTAIGLRNIENLKSLGVDYIEVTVNPVLRRTINRLALERVGDISWPEHVTIFTIPVRLAVALGIRLIVWGENPQDEYGGDYRGHTLDRAWLERHGGLLGLSVADLALDPRQIVQYTYPSDDELTAAGVTGIFLGYFLPWDGYGNALYSQAHGFETYSRPVEGSLVNYENLDNGQTGIHDYFKWLKYGFGRATDLACSHIRRGRLRRDEAIGLVRRHDGLFPWSYVGVPLADVLEDMDMSLDEFVAICDRWTNRDIFKSDGDNRLVKDRHGNLTKRNYPVTP